MPFQSGNLCKLKDYEFRILRSQRVDFKRNDPVSGRRKSNTLAELLASALPVVSKTAPIPL